MNIQQFANKRQQTKFELLKKKILKIANELLDKEEADIESGVGEGIYDAEDNTDTLAAIEKQRQLLKTFEGQQPAIYLCIEGGNLQGISANCEIDVNVYDVDNYNVDNTSYDLTPKQWDAKIKTLTKKKEIKPVF